MASGAAGAYSVLTEQVMSLIADGLTGDAFAWAMLLATMGVAAAIDVRTRRIPNEIVVAALVVRCCTWTVGVISGDVAAPSALDEMLSGVLLAGLALGLALMLCRLRGGVPLGGGDVKLILVMGFYLGFIRASLAVAAASILMVIASLAMALLRRRSIGGLGRTTHPFAPWLLAGCVVVLVWQYVPG